MHYEHCDEHYDEQNVKNQFVKRQRLPSFNEVQD